MTTSPHPVRGKARSRPILFVLVGLALYAALAVGAEWLAWRNGHMNPFFKIEASSGDFDWVILGASHAMPLDYDGFDARIEDRTGLRILNLSGPGTGPLYNRLASQTALRQHVVRGIIYAVDGFAFRSPDWNERRLEDPDLLARTPWRLPILTGLARLATREGVDPRAWLGYATSFFKINDRTRFARDVFAGERQFDRVFRQSATATRKRIDYLYPPVADEDGAFDRYIAVLEDMVRQARRTGTAFVIVKLPLPRAFASELPGEAAFDARIRAFAARQRVRFEDFTDVLPESSLYADTDHLNRAGAQAFLDRHLADLLKDEAGISPAASDTRQAGRR